MAFDSIEELADYLSPLDLSWKEMMGEYRLYVDGAQIGLLSEGRLLLTVTDASESAFPTAERISPYGSPEMISAEHITRDDIVDVIPRMCSELPKRKACRLY